MAVAAAAQDRPADVVFVCEHGSVKSVIAAQWFNRMAAERGLRVKAISRGVDPDARIPEGVAANLKKDAFDPGALSPVRLREADLASGAQVVAIGVKSPLFEKLTRPPHRWDAIPPASVDYDAARDAMKARLTVLLDALAKTNAK